jgi:hypothetical protein
VGRLRKNATWARLLTPSKPTRDTMTVVSIAMPDSNEAAEQALETDASLVLSRAAPASHDLEDAVFESTGAGGTLVPPLVLLAGELELRFDEVARIKALVAAARPLAPFDATLAGVLDQASAMVETPLQHAPDVAEELVARIRTAWAEAGDAPDPGTLELQTTRALLAARAYQRRGLFGDACVRALFRQTGAGVSIPAYLPEPVAKKLPLFPVMSVRMLAELVPQQDAAEASPVAAKVLALARVVTRAAR